MKFDRRSFLLGGAVAIPAGWTTVACAAASPVFRPEDFGARGDGRTDDTRAIQTCLDRAPAGAVIQLRHGAVYRVDTNWRPTWAEFGGLKLKAGQRLQLNGAELKALPTDQVRGAVVQAYGVHGWRIEGPGRITGERDVHRGSTGEWGMGVAAFSSSGWAVGGGVEISQCWGDGLYVSAQGPGGRFCEDFLSEDVHIHHCRRNGISIISGRDGEIRRFNIHDVAGTNPQGGIDLEPDDPKRPNRNIRIRDGRIRNVQVGVYVALANEDILIAGNDIEAENSGVLVGNYAARVQIVDNPRIANRIGGVEGGAIRTVARETSQVRSLHIRRNSLHGGGGFVVDIAELGYVDLVIEDNRLHASNKGVQGIARLGTGRFTRNTGVIERNAGVKGEFYVLFDGVRYGGNVYRNLSPHPMYALIRNGSVEIGPESYSGPR